ncbi:MLO-like protein 4 [Trifolium pratense]|uniref:MLO-like protein 4 n=1 Tax=Trifolium pratense TaxID=57577 RepID=UPI001E6946CD|nr:MLO-like protein 4 [Trifolium pratense]
MIANMVEENEEGRSLAETPTWAVATVITLLVSLSFLSHGTLNKLIKWLGRTKRKSLLSALEKMKEELMLFGLLSLLMGHWIVFVAKICVKSSVLSSRFFPCAMEKSFEIVKHDVWLNSEYSNRTILKEQVNNGRHNYCPKGHESFASYESLEQLHRFVFVLGITHVSYSFVAVALAMIKIYSWRTWENEAKTMAMQSLQDTSQSTSTSSIRLKRLSTFIFHHTSHPWSHHKVLVWLLCFSRQFWSSINRSDYIALRLGFITNHDLPLTYDFHNYMLRSMDEEFRDIVGVSVILWIYAICCIFLNFHGNNFYFWLSFVPAILILVIGTKLHRVVVKLAVEVIDQCPYMKPHQFNLRDELFWFGKPRLLLRLIQLISFLNAFEMSTFIWSLWEINNPSCFMNNQTLVVVRLSFGVVSQVWCSFITFPLYVIITQMGSRFKKSVISENVRKSLYKWQKRVKEKQSSSYELLNTTTTTSSESWQNGMDNANVSILISETEEGNSSGIKDICFSNFDDGPLSPSYDEDDHDHDVKYDEFSTPSMS